jgi:hypothetical protein
MFPAPHGSVCAALLVPGTRMNLKVKPGQGKAPACSLSTRLSIHLFMDREDSYIIMFTV